MPAERGVLGTRPRMTGRGVLRGEHMMCCAPSNHKDTKGTKGRHEASGVPFAQLMIIVDLVLG